eukprot:CAMPEP_0172573424 /NCGR_PEP_ID=MMETSP1067-20121228/136184_1 /TAXON_ID=265564 ORGANISM="Thalassiosira punctigera, Strain Tpunct2005C2" /NCGR_SAMPLE_ID=MMETSP1067 /ASSEMBLY_ACC=CAM_ASM_000444 /LENGTH=35 /DNA_ID= /DNA_START= /DNA_END= /DNA_ORIENTATION=
MSKGIAPSARPKLLMLKGGAAGHFARGDARKATSN